jgi:hypothetical protein
MSFLRIVRQGHPVDPSLFVDLGPSVGRRTFTRGAVYGGTLVVGGPRGRTVDQQRAAEEVTRNAEAARRYYERNRAEVLERQRARRAAAKPPCGKWIILARAECTRPVRHQGACA